MHALLWFHALVTRTATAVEVPKAAATAVRFWEFLQHCEWSEDIPRDFEGPFGQLNNDPLGDVTTAMQNIDWAELRDSQLIPIFPTKKKTIPTKMWLQNEQIHD